MSYTALYRKFRPDNFDDVKGQEHIVTTLKNQIATGRLGHAYLFCGTRGTGKTTVAKIFAKAVNCEHPVGENPCGQCPTCKAIASGSAVNVIEMDAASNRKIEDIRQVIEEIAYPPVTGKYKVYIVDEVHMLTDQASNALLKTLEEPPEYVIFILATTDPQKLLTTILSRCQRYDFRRISIDTITARLAEVLSEEQVEAEERALRYVAKCADGSMRDALSLLDQCVAFHFGQKLTYDMTLDVLGAVDTDVYGQMLTAIMQRDVTAAIAKLDEIVVLGRDLVFFVDDFTWYLRNLLLIKSNDNMEDLIDMSTEHLAILKEQAAELPRDTLMRYISIFCALSNRIKYEAQKRVLIEIELIRMCTPQMDVDVASLTQRMDELEAGIRNASFAPLEGTASEKADTPSRTAAPAKPTYPEALSEDIAAVIADWNNIKKGFGGNNGVAMQNAILKSPDGKSLTIVFDNTLGEVIYKNETFKNEVVESIRSYMKKQVDIHFSMAASQSAELAGSGDLRDADLTQFGALTVETEEA